MCRTRHSEVGATQHVPKGENHGKGMKPTKDSNNKGTLFYPTNRHYYSVRKHISIWKTGKRSPLIQLSARRCAGVLLQSIAVHIVFLCSVYIGCDGNNFFVSQKSVTPNKGAANGTSKN